MGHVYTVAMHKGGAGKTSVITNLAGVIAIKEPEKRVLIIDTDGQSNALMAFGKSPNDYPNGIHSLFVKSANVRDCIYNLRGNIDIIPATDDMNFIEFDILLDDNFKGDPFGQLDNAIAEIKDEYDYIFVDTPPSLNIVTGTALKIADKVIVPLEPETFGVSGVNKIIETVKELRDSFQNGMEILGVVGVKVKARSKSHKETMLEAKHYFKHTDVHLFEHSIKDSVIFPDSTRYNGLPATLVNPRNKFVKEYFKLFDEMIKVEKGVHTNE